MKSKVLLTTLVLLSLIVSSSIAMAAPLKKPTATITGTPTSGYAPLSVQFTSKTTGSPTSYYWVFEPQSSSDWNSHHAVTAVHTFKKPGVYTVSLVVTNAAGSTTVTKTKYITVLAAKPTKKPTATFTANKVSGKTPLSVSFTSTTTGNPTEYFWVFEPQSNSDWNSHHAVTAVHTFKKPGVYTVSLAITNAAGTTTATRTKYITVTK